MTIRLMEWPEMKALHDEVYEVMKGEVEHMPELPPQLMVLGEKTKKGGRHHYLVSEKLMRVFFSDDGGKDKMMYFIKSLLTEDHEIQTMFAPVFGFSPVCVVQINEAWMGRHSGPGEKFVRPSEDPNRKEVLLIVIHTPGLSIPTCHEIIPIPFRHLKRGEFPRGGEFLGRMSLQDPENKET